jgi:hypothetical protein
VHPNITHNPVNAFLPDAFAYPEDYLPDIHASVVMTSDDRHATVQGFL